MTARTAIVTPGFTEAGASVPQPDRQAERSRLHWPGRDPLARTTTALAANTVVTSALGLAFWLLASHRYTAGQVGIDSALISSMMLLSSLTELNFNTAIPRLLPRLHRSRSRSVALCYLATGTAGAVLTMAFALVVPHFVGSLRFLTQRSGLMAALVVGVTVFNLFAVQDAVLIACRWAGLVPIENAAFGVAKLVLMVVLVGRVAGHGIFVSWLIAALGLVIPVSLLLFGRVLRSAPAPVSERTFLPTESRRMLVRYLVHDWFACLLGQGTADLLPLIVLAVLGRAVTGYFYIAFIVATAATTLAQSFSTSLLVEAAHDESALHLLTRRTVLRCAVFIVPFIVIGIIIAPIVLRLFGVEYSAQAGDVLRLLLLAALPQTMVAIAMSVERIRGRAERALRYQAVAAVAALSLAIPLMRVAGLAGIGWAWLAAQSVAALLAVGTLRHAGTRQPAGPAIEGVG